jgi:hypothetical protein
VDQVDLTQLLREHFNDFRTYSVLVFFLVFFLYFFIGWIHGSDIILLLIPSDGVSDIVWDLTEPITIEMSYQTLLQPTTEAPKSPPTTLAPTQNEDSSTSSLTLSIITVILPILAMLQRRWARLF